MSATPQIRAVALTLRLFGLDELAVVASLSNSLACGHSRLCPACQVAMKHASEQNAAPHRQ